MNAKMNFGNASTNRSMYYKRKSTLRSCPLKRAEIIAWVLFFGVGVAYFVACVILAAH